MRDRIEELIYHVADRSRVWKSMEELTGVSGKSWQNTVRGNQRPSSDMIEAIGRVWPRYVYWLVTGMTDEKSGHTSPILERIARDLSKVQKAG